MATKDWFVTVGVPTDGGGDYAGQNLYGPFTRAEAEAYLTEVNEALEAAASEFGEKKAFPYGKVNVDLHYLFDVADGRNTALDAARNWCHDPDRNY